MTLNENAPVGTTVVQVNATDLDEGKNGEVVYALGNNVKNNLRRLFKVNEITGEIILIDHLDFEVKDKYEIDIQASDKGTIPLATDKSVIIKIVDVMIMHRKWR